MSNEPSSSGAWRGAALISEDSINSALDSSATRTTESPNAIPDRVHTDTNAQDASVQIDLRGIFDQFLPELSGDGRAALTQACNVFAQARERVDDLEKRGAQLKGEVDEHSKTLAVCCESFAVANRNVAEQDALVRRLVGDVVGLEDASGEQGERLQKEVEGAQERLAWLSAESGRQFAKVHEETDAMIGKRAEMRRVRARALAHQTGALAIARGEDIPTPEETHRHM